MRYATLPISYKLFIESLARRKKQELKNSEEFPKSTSRLSSNKNTSSGKSA
jgi:hypothetical protein